MQTFVPAGGDFELGFHALDYKRLGKQRVEAWQILNALRGVDNEGNPRKSNGWVNHPAVRMWKGHEVALSMYGMACCSVWMGRGYNDSMWGRFLKARNELAIAGKPIKPPEWLEDPKVALSHKSNLIRKLPSHYKKLWPDVPDDLPYVWPV